jgi:PhnB protein
MASTLNPYLNFDANAREAMEFYQSVLGGDLVINTFGEYMPDAGDIADQVMHASLQTEAGYTIFASDTPPGMQSTPGTSITVSISGDETERLRGYWAGLTEGGTIEMRDSEDDVFRAAEELGIDLSRREPSSVEEV